ncbi:MAG: RNA-splicing ligase RtcB [Frankiales bacterium]|nr:RNA-splicing ligase RtcB [Frankiales bacterium]MCW2587528.1 RNA-splicing ligase RtcB [Frankiales bacterium]
MTAPVLPGRREGVRIIGEGRHEVAEAPLAHLREIAAEDGLLAAPAVILPDFHHKKKQEMPSSVAVATNKHIVPHFTASSVNCGMALLSTGLNVEDLSPKLLDSFIDQVKLRAPHPMPLKAVLNRKEVFRAAREGASFAIERYGLDTEEIKAVEHRGRIELEEGTDERILRRFAPRLSAEASRFRFGGVGPGNHFIEVQVCQEILDPVAAAAMGVHKGMVVVEYHGGGGVWAGEMGRLFVPRKKSTGIRRARTAALKAAMHASVNPSVLKERWDLYFHNVRHAIEADSPEGKRLWMSYCTAMNYGFAYRIASYQVIRESLTAAWGSPVSTKLVYDSPHNSVYKEEVDGELAFVHRHNTARAVGPGILADHPLGQPVLVPGTNRTSSYLCIGASGSGISLDSACHGAGTLVGASVKAGTAGPDPDRVTRRYNYADSTMQEVAHVGDAGVDLAVDILRDENILRPVARFTPVAGLT